MRTIAPAFCLAWLLLAAPARADAPPAEAGPPAEVRLRHVVGDFSMGLGIDTGREIAFSREPAYAGGQVVRGQLLLRSNQIPFAADVEGRKLYLDLNHNGDLTDDPEGVFEGEKGWQLQFSSVQLKIEHEELVLPLVLSLSFMGEHCYGQVSSGWRGEIELDGRPWLVEVSTLDGVLEPGNGRFWMRPPELTQQGGVGLPRQLALDGSLYQLEYAFAAGADQPELVVRFKPDAPAQSGTLRLAGGHLRRLVLHHNHQVAILSDPPVELTLPAGHWQVADVQAGPGGKGSLYVPEQMHEFKTNIPVGGVGELNLGGKLTNSVTVERRGTDLSINYQLVDSDDHAWRPIRREGTPQAEIWKGEKLLAQGNFEYG